MESHLPRPYQYIKINDYFFCLQQNYFILCWILYFRRSDLHAIYTPWIKTSSPIRILGYVRYHLRKVTFVVKTLIPFILTKLKLQNINQAIELPLYGNLCKHVHKGYKIFNLKSRTVIKFFDDVNKESITDELERMKMVSSIDFAPSLKRWNIDEGWYEEEYACGTPPAYYQSIDSAALLTSFKSEIIPCLNKLMLHRPQKNMNCSDYVNKLLAILHSIGPLNEKKNDITSKFIFTIVDRLRHEENVDINLVFSHGDFCPANILSTQTGIKMLDWENAGYRSALFDFYSFFFYRPACIRSGVEMMAVEIDEALPKFISETARKPAHITETFDKSIHTYRLIYYIEQICRLVERKLTDKNLDIDGFISQYIDVFNQYEEILEIKAPKNGQQT